jgi:hypothetical protein
MRGISMKSIIRRDVVVSKTLDDFVDDISNLAWLAEEFELDFEKFLKQALGRSWRGSNDIVKKIHEEMHKEINANADAGTGRRHTNRGCI